MLTAESVAAMPRDEKFRRLFEMVSKAKRIGLSRREVQETLVTNGCPEAYAEQVLTACYDAKGV